MWIIFLLKINLKKKQKQLEIRVEKQMDQQVRN